MKTKSHLTGWRALALAGAIGASMLLGGCAGTSGGGESDATASAGGDNVLGVYKFEVDPGAGTLDISPVAAVSTTKANPLGTGLAVSSSNVVTGKTTTADVTIKSTATSAGTYFEGLHLSVINVDAVGQTAVMDTGDICSPGSDLGTCALNGAGAQAAYVYVSESLADGPETTIGENAANPALGSGNVSPLWRLHGECGTVTASWSLTNTDTTTYNFFGALYGDVHQNNASDRQYLNTAALIVEANALDGLLGWPGRGASITSAKAGEWFYVSYKVDMPDSLETVSKPLIGSTTPYWYAARISPVMRYDPAVLQAAPAPLTGSYYIYLSGPGSTYTHFIADPDCPAGTTPDTDAAAAGSPPFCNTGQLDGFNGALPSINSDFVCRQATGTCQALTEPAVNAYLWTPGSKVEAPRQGGEIDGNPGIIVDYDFLYWTMQMKPGTPAGVGTHLSPEPGSNSKVRMKNTNGDPVNQGSHSAEVTVQPNNTVLKAYDDAANFPWGAPDNTGSYNLLEAYICSSG